jgi:hypothetical protein
MPPRGNTGVALELAAGEHGAGPPQLKRVARPRPATPLPQPTPARSSHEAGGTCAARTLLRAGDSAHNQHERSTSQLAAQDLHPIHGPHGQDPAEGQRRMDPPAGLVTQTGPGADDTTSQVERPSGRPAGQGPRLTLDLPLPGPGGHWRRTDPPAARPGGDSDRARLARSQP